MAKTTKIRALFALGAIGLYAVGTVAPAAAAGNGTASAFAIKADVFGTNVIPETPKVTTTGADVDDTVIAIPGDPLVVNGTLIGKSAVHAGLASELNQDASKHALAGPYDARAIGQIEDLNILIDEGVPGGQLVNADLIRAEAVAKCSAQGVATFAASSEVVDLQIGGEDPFSGPLNDALKQITEGLAPLADLISVQLNVTSVGSDHASVDAVVVTLLAAAAENGAPGPLAQIRLGHAEVTGNPCGGPSLASTTQCSDGVDNADPEDTVADAADPGCHSDADATNTASYVPSDNDETNTQCSDGIDNDDPEDTLADADDPGCHLDGDLAKPYHPEYDDERNTSVLAGGALPKTGAAIPTGLAAGLGIGALSLLALRRRLAAV